MDRNRRLKILLSSVFVLVLFLGTLIASWKFEDNVDDIESSNVLGRIDIHGVPKIASIAPISVLKGQEYIYDVNIQDSDSDVNDLFVEFVEKPTWLYIEDNRVRGVPREEGTFKFVLKVSDGENYSLQENYILVNSSNE